MSGLHSRHGLEMLHGSFEMGPAKLADTLDILAHELRLRTQSPITAMGFAPG